VQNEILIDSGPLIALFDRDDNFHKRTVDFIQGKNYRFVSTVAVVTEVSHMLDFDVRVQIDFFGWVMREGVRLCDIGQPEIPRIIELTRKYCDRPMDFADATLVVAAERTGIRSIISLDADFDVYRLPGKLHIQNVFY